MTVEKIGAKANMRKISPSMIPIIGLSALIVGLAIVLTLNIIAIVAANRLKAENQSNLDESRARMNQLLELEAGGATVERKIKRFSEMMPETVTKDEIFKKVGGLSGKYGIAVHEIKFEAYQPEQGVSAGAIAYTLTLTGGYGDTMSMLNELCGHDRIVQLKQLKLAGISGQNGKVQSNALVAEYYTGGAKREGESAAQ